MLDNEAPVKEHHVHQRVCRHVIALGIELANITVHFPETLLASFVEVAPGLVTGFGVLQEFSGVALLELLVADVVAYAARMVRPEAHELWCIGVLVGVTHPLGNSP
uniref:Uncharacterized protein n=1 Tax=Arundo donax TaxID=35708 RepID=A0A0A8ZVL3_ARUDO